MITLISKNTTVFLIYKRKFKFDYKHILRTGFITQLHAHIQQTLIMHIKSVPEVIGPQETGKSVMQNV